MLTISPHPEIRDENYGFAGNAKHLNGEMLAVILLDRAIKNREFSGTLE